LNEDKLMTARLQEVYAETVKPSLISEFGYKSPMEAPKITKIVVNMGMGEAVADSKKINSAVNDMTLITGQKPVVTKAKHSIATYKLREGMPIGVKVTLARVCRSASR
jgi:large subunit ribosomal protein L5